MTSFSSRLRELVDEWRKKGDTDEDLIQAMLNEIESLRDLQGK